MNDKNHIHKLKMHKYANGTRVFFCVNNCNYKVEASLALGKKVLCYYCDRQMIMGERDLAVVRPHCPLCSKRKIKDENGDVRYVRRTSDILTAVAADKVNSLKERLANASSNPNIVKDEVLDDSDI